MGIRIKRPKRFSTFRKTGCVGGERAKYFNQGIQDRNRKAKPRYEVYPSLLNCTNRQYHLFVAYRKGYNGEKL